ncbi:MAG: dockerin type I domain-containing protein [Planctomycetota bacterium]
MTRSVSWIASLGFFVLGSLMGVAFPGDAEICDDGLDNDGDRAIDCTDADCVEEPVCPVAPPRGGGVVELFCEDSDLCVDDTFELVFETDRSTLPVSGGVIESIPVRIVTRTSSRPVLGWSFAVATPNALRIVEGSVTTDGTLVDPAVPGSPVIPPSFNDTDIVDGGFISSVLLSFLSETELPFGERNVICKVEYAVDEPLDRPIEIRFLGGRLGRHGEGGREIYFTVGNGPARLPRHLVHGLLVPEDCSDLVDNDEDGLVDCDDADCSGATTCNGASFRRGDANGDGRINVSDVVPLVRNVFGNERRAFDCKGAFDSNADGKVSVADAARLISWLFRDGQPPEPPFFECGSVGVCAESSVGCTN